MRLLVITLLLAFLGSAAIAQEVVCPEGYVCTRSDTDSVIRSEGTMDTTITQPPPSAVSPTFSAGSNTDLCTIGTAGAVQTQILGISAGTTFTEENCLRLKNAKTMYDMGMKVAAVSIMCQDEAVFDAMMDAGTPCPYDGKIGEEAKIGWESDAEERSNRSDGGKNVKKVATYGIGGLLALLLLL
jgi:hypothetical protein